MADLAILTYTRSPMQKGLALRLRVQGLGLGLGFGTGVEGLWVPVPRPPGHAGCQI